MRDEYLIRPNEQRPGWPSRKDFDKGPDGDKAFDKAVADEQRKVRYYGLSGDDCVDWREMVLDVTAEATTTHPRLDGKVDRTIPWRDPAHLDLVRKGKRVIVRPRFRYGRWEEDALGSVRYVYLTWDVREAP